MKKRNLLIFSLAFLLMAVTVGEYAELETLMNAREYANFLKTTKNIRFTVPKGTVGKVVNFETLPSGNMGIQLELKNHKPNEKVWVYFWPNAKTPNMKFYKDNPLEKAGPALSEPAEGAYSQAEQDTIAIRGEQRSTPPSKKEINDQVKKSLESLKKINQPESQEPCLICETMAGQEKPQECETKKQKVGSLMIYQIKEGPLCQVHIQKEDSTKSSWARQYSFFSDGHYESQDLTGAQGNYFFPRKNQVSYKVSPDGESVIVQTTSDVEIHFSTKTGKISKVTNVKSWEEGSIDSTHLKIQPLPTNPILDLPYVAGASPELSSSRRSLLRSGDNKACTFTNSELFTYIRESDGSGRTKSASFKFKKDSDFLRFAQGKCR